MARYPLATWNPAGTTPGGTIVPRVVIFHVIAGEGNARPHSGLEWHFEVSYSGAVEQSVDTSRRADANNKANGFAISIETEGLGPGFWTDAQLDSLVDLSEWCIAEPEHDIARQITPTWDGTGFGYHVMFGAPGPWTPVAKSCPGPKRIRQFHDELMPRILNPHQEDDLNPTQDARLLELYQLLKGQNPDGPAGPLNAAIARTDANSAIAAGKAPTKATLQALSDEDINEIAEAVNDEAAERLKA